MTKQLYAIDPGTDSFESWIETTNQLVDLANSEVVTVNTAGATSTGNGFVNGYFGANVLFTDELRGGTLDTPNTLVISTNTICGDSTITVGNSSVNSYINSSSITFSNSSFQSGLDIDGLIFGGVVVNASSLSIGNSTINSVVTPGDITINNSASITGFTDLTSGLSQHPVDSFLLSEFRGGQYTITITDDAGGNAYQISQLLVIHTGDSALVTEFGVITTNGTLGVFDATTNTSHCILNLTPAAANTIVRVARTMLVA